MPATNSGADYGAPKLDWPSSDRETAGQAHWTTLGNAINQQNEDMAAGAELAAPSQGVGKFIVGVARSDLMASHGRDGRGSFANWRSGTPSQILACRLEMVGRAPDPLEAGAPC